MKRMHIVPAAAVVIMLAAPAMAAEVGVSITVGQPGFYGRIDIGGAPPPVLINPAPVVIVRPQAGVVVEPVYLRVPPGHQKNWAKHCREYNACGHPVYFVRDSWYTDVYVPHYRKHHGEGERGRDRDEDHDHGKGKAKGRKDD